MAVVREEARELLGHVLVELRQRTGASASRYDVIRSAGLLRLLVCDRRPPTLLEDALGDSLSDLRFVTRTPARMRMTGRFSGAEAPTVLSRGLTPFDVETVTASLTLDEFAGAEVAQVALGDGDEPGGHSVDHVIKYAANVLGGVHYRQPKGRQEQARAALLDSRPLRDLPWSLQDIAGVVLNALHTYEPSSPGVLLRSAAEYR